MVATCSSTKTIPNWDYATWLESNTVERTILDQSLVLQVLGVPSLPVDSSSRPRSNILIRDVGPAAGLVGVMGEIGRLSLSSSGLACCCCCCFRCPRLRLADLDRALFCLEEELRE